MTATWPEPTRLHPSAGGPPWPTADAVLERRYRLLLRAYPGAYRRRHGTEVVTTLLEMAEPGQRRPSVSDAAHLVGSGLRQRFRLPVGALTVVAAVLVAVALGVLGAGAGSWLGWRTAADLPDDTALAQLAATAGVPTGEVGQWQGAVLYSPITSYSGQTTNYAAEQARDRLVAQGWQAGPVERPTGGSTTTTADGASVEVPTRNDAFTATRDGLVLQVRAHTVLAPAGSTLTAGDGHSTVEVWSAQPGVVTPFTVAGAVLGALAGWLLTAWLGYLLRQRTRARRWAATALAAGALAAIVQPTSAAVQNLFYLTTAPQGDWVSKVAHGDYLYGTTGVLTAVALIAGVGAVLLGATGAHPQPQPQVVRPG